MKRETSGLFPTLRRTSCKYYWVWHNLPGSEGNFNSTISAIIYAKNRGWLEEDQYYEIVEK